ncbi:SRPBCC family protein [Microbacterium sp. JZ31]|uniref:SRPBCC family protein n=1 Tax=Microbacterium sp. JZ31 TaxID=1906274 RepID=UPI001931B423|nr:SRPBCC family protein [Microbacterium sp. JZ31]
MTTTLTAEIDVDAPVDTVYNQWTQFESFPQFLGAVKSVQQIDDVRTRWSVSIGGKEEEFYADIVDQVPDSHVAWQSTDGAFHAGRVEFEPHGSETRVKLRMEWEPEGLIEKVGAALNIDEAQAKMDLERFKKFIEERGSETGSWRGEVHGAQETSPDL